VSGGCPFYRLAAQDLRSAPASSEEWGAVERGGRRRSCLGSRPLRRKPPERGRALLGLVGLLLFLFEVLGRAALSRSLLVKALSLLELALAAWGLERGWEG
jgi:hypothetical protein